ncbi:Transcriptional activator protein acu-15 [Fulvia fulva]|uniref:Transcriptional activator protein acu-15 n=1 Tax=Passalora fulva TaxID=5499 RepID=A0A9Q8LIP2_PASFU|nr:Transcriptional activator protein acu-15 [Fulvia fulva]KAK4623733.1 Transcriptional activator protein acu-15 [Fulvia fulva]UJO18100.1 Transcriptional activator protein acu-15 [Fulvia fulva]WPV15244.1 Transcriptional activator protein acu-15 [Fulvia fulva]WPV29651.1 Transcriptional activator protein acu-15 [Fulvia fulva]
MEHKRRRVTRACDRCRILKTKCDGQQPICSRCSAYGYACKWNHGGRRGITHPDVSLSLGATPSSVAPSEPDMTSLQEAVRAYDELLSTLRTNVPEGERAKVDLAQARIRTHLPSELWDQLPSPKASEETETQDNYGTTESRPRSAKYLGWSSDVEFVNSIQELLRDSRLADQPSVCESYEKTDSTSQRNSQQYPLRLPTRKIADHWLETFFATIHVAHPVVCQQRFRLQYVKFCESLSTSDVSRTWSATFLSILALGSYYDTFSNGESWDSCTHEGYFMYSQAMTKSHGSEHSRDYVCLLIVQCLYLLATVQTDKCWTTLGTAIRIAQSLGLHVEDEATRRESHHFQIEHEMRRRTWHSLYVLDRLLALQLGRPLAINHADTAVKPPSQIDDMEFDLAGDRIPDPTFSWRPQFGDYFRAVVRFSHIVGSVVRDLYRPNSQQNLDFELVEDIDKRLLQWRSELPQSLRFDMEHSTDTTVTLRRQRNILSIKFHHLRALLHRVHLCLPWLLSEDSSIMSISDAERQQIVSSEAICVSEARAIARTMENVNNEQDLVHDFPFWQMISCLICGASILLVASKFQVPPSPVDTVTALEADAAVCIRIFDALSAHSDAARLAAKMMRALQLYKRSTVPLPWRPRNIRSSVTQETAFPTPSYASTPFTTAATDYGSANWVTNDSWPSECSDSLSWSSQFVTLDDFFDPGLYLGADMASAVGVPPMQTVPTAPLNNNMQVMQPGALPQWP